MSGAIAAVVLLGLAASASQGAAPCPDGGYFAERAAATGVDFVHQNGMSGRLYLPEEMGSGVALLDYDGDGDLDVYLVQGGLLDDVDPSTLTFPPRSGDLPYRDRLFRNDLHRGPDGTLEPRFVDVTATAGLDARGYGMGVATGDVDGDGDVDLYVTNLGANTLWRNEGDGTFSDATATAGVGGRRWSVSAAFLDADGDGDLDLYAGNYLVWGPAVHRTCPSAGGTPDYCGPLAFEPEHDDFYRNRGDGTFEDAGRVSGLATEPSSGLGVVAGDLDDDGDVDLYVANDGRPNFLHLNRGDGTFEEAGLLAGCAVNEEGRSEASMGVDAVDYDLDGDEDLFMTHQRQETNTLYANAGGGLFREVTIPSGLGPASLEATSFGTAWIDVDHDGLQDLLVVNGLVRRGDVPERQDEPYPLDQPNQLFRGLPGGRFEDASACGGEDFERSEVSRGAAVGDLDEDGDADVVVSNNAGPARVLVNRVGQDRPSVRLRLLDGAGAPALGAWVGVVPREGATRWRRVRTAASYASAHDPRLLVGWGGLGDVDRVDVTWPDGRRKVLRGVPVGPLLVTRSPDGGLP